MWLYYNNLFDFDIFHISSWKDSNLTFEFTQPPPVFLFIMYVDDVSNTNGQLVIHISSVIIQCSALSYARNCRCLIVNLTDFIVNIFFLSSWRSKSAAAITDASAQEAIDTRISAGSDSDDMTTRHTCGMLGGATILAIGFIVSIGKFVEITIVLRMSAWNNNIFENPFSKWLTRVKLIGHRHISWVFASKMLHFYYENCNFLIKIFSSLAHQD